ncbi:hypothetical protein CPB83DRAFT_864917 [Crepidotus variabilis]|uniref:Uncharacterized protein n=1 Tax=Crepidotus variabilis TaxID=179855 RepID=A0A9P6JIK5_9AGAR|nr:hypothetical protein CPB83DRAFT_864917 [Crepidotus variabilis]
MELTLSIIMILLLLAKDVLSEENHSDLRITLEQKHPRRRFVTPTTTNDLPNISPWRKLVPLTRFLIEIVTPSPPLEKKNTIKLWKSGVIALLTSGLLAPTKLWRSLQN